jgi:hypothetical protein
MRKDMKKVLTERPRRGHGRCYHDIRASVTRLDYDDLPSKEGIQRCYGWSERKEFSDLLGPLKRFLWSCRGRRWDEVWSEICGQLSNNTTGAHLKGHVMSEVEIHTYLDEEGAVRCRGRYIFGSRIVSGLYVHPVTGLLCGNEKKRASYRGAREPYYMQDGIGYRKGDDGVLRPRSSWPYRHRYGNGVPVYSRKIIGAEREAVYIGGFWYWVIFATVPAPDVTVAENGEKRTVNYVRTDFVTGETVRQGRYRADKRQMGAPDLRRHGLINE